MHKELKVNAGKPYPIGVYREKDGIQISMVASGKTCGILLYDQDKNPIGQAELSKASRLGKLCYGKIESNSDKTLNEIFEREKPFFYQLYADEEIIFDSYMKAYEGCKNFAHKVTSKELFGRLDSVEFDREDDCCPGIPYEESAVYCMHVRGFTKHSSSGVKGKGTFRGLIEKLPYLEELGITTLELMPVYELQDIQKKNPSGSVEVSGSVVISNPVGNLGEVVPLKKEEKINYWGYDNGFYYAPRNAYAMSGNGDMEFKELVKALHKKKMEVVLQFYFPKTMVQCEIIKILRYWRMEYHVDGFHLKGENLPLLMILQDPGLSDVKLFGYNFPVQQVYGENNIPFPRNLAYYNDDYMYAMRKFLKGDEDMVPTALRLMRRQPMEAGQINYFTNYYGFTLADMVSYERKHNEANGEENRDGNDYNHTWNCGVEGKSRKKAIVALRNKQIRNALCMLMFSQGTPLLFMGDEFGNSQNGNNNPYCQDNETTWLNWKNKEQNKELFEYTKKLLTLRKNHPILHKPTELRLMDYISCGFPDLSYHATKAWQPDMSNYTRHIGVLYCGKYAKIPSGEEDCFFYVAMNMHWEPHEFALPKLPKGMNWHMLANTENWDIWDGEEPLLKNQQSTMVEPRNVQVYISKKGNGKK